MKVAVIQFDVIPNDIRHNENTAKALIEQCASEVDLIVLPELWNCGYDLEQLANNAQTLRGSSVSLLQKLAKTYDVWIFGGSIAEKKRRQIF